MTNSAMKTSVRRGTCAANASKSPNWAVMSWLMSHRKSYWFDPMQNPSDAFVEYLEGYASSLDIYSVCSRKPLGQPDISSVVDDFWKVAADYAESTDEHAKNRARLSWLKGIDIDGQGTGTKGK